MQHTIFTLLVASAFWRCALGARLHAAGRSASAAQQDDESPVTKVVRLLEQMLEKSKQDGVEEKEMFVKHKCYCDHNEEEKTAEVTSLTEQISLLEGKVEGMKAKNAILSEEVAELTQKMTENKEEQEKALAVRQKEEEEFKAFDLDMTESIAKLEDAYAQLLGVSADQTMASAAGHAQYMASHEELFLKLTSSVKQALLAASAFTSEAQAKKVDAFLQMRAPTYSSQSGEVVGIIKNMRETFKANLEDAKAKEETAATAFAKLTLASEEAYTAMEDSLGSKQTKLAAIDGSLAQAKEDLELATTSKDDAEKFLEELTKTCTEAATQYTEREQLRASEEVAISKAIAILNSDAAFASFGKVAATSGTSPETSPEPMLIQLDEQKVPSAARRQQVSKQLRAAAKGKNWPGLPNVLSLLETGNPFKSVLEAMDKMLELITEEEEADKKKFDWCKDERSKKEEQTKELVLTIDGLKETISGLVVDIDDPAIGLKVSIKETETSLLENTASMKEITAERTGENLKYQKNIKNLVEAKNLLERAVSVLKAYYEGVLKMTTGTGFLQHQKRSAALLQTGEDPEAWALAGQSYGGQGAEGVEAINLVELILDDTKKEEALAHADEDEAQQNFEKEMTEHKDSETILQDLLAARQLELTEKEEELLSKRADLKSTVEVKDSVDAYMEKIKDGCDFIEENYESRKTSRTAESEALNTAISALKESAAYKNAADQAETESFGDCADKCAIDKEHVDCKACLAKTSVPGYCAGHAGTPGC